MPSELAGLLLLWLPGLLALAAALALAAGPLRVGRVLAVAAAAAAVALGLAGPDGPFRVPGLLVGATAGLDPEGRLALFVAAGAVLPGGLRLRGAAPAPARPGDAPAWRALLAAGLAATGVAFDAASLAFGFTALVLAAYGAAAAGKPGRRGAAAFLALAILGEVLLVDGLAELGNAAESASLDAMREAAHAEVGAIAIALVAGAYGLPLGILGVRGPGAAAAALAAAAVVGVFRVLPGPGRPRDQALAAAGVVVVAAVASLVARAVAARPARAPAAAHAGHGHAGAEAPAPASPAPPGGPAPRLGLAERALLGPATSGALVLAVLVALYLAFHG